MVAGPGTEVDTMRLERLHSCASTITLFKRLDSAASSGPAIQFTEDRLFALHLDDLCERLRLTLPQVEAAPIGVGAHGTVFRALDDATGAPVALKVVWDPERFRREVAILEAIRTRRNVVQLLRSSSASEAEAEEGGLMGLVLRLAPLTLRHVVDNCALCIREGRVADLASHADYVPRAALHILAGLSDLHQAGFVHGDVHPANILVCADGTARLADFGEAWTPSERLQNQQHRQSGSGDRSDEEPGSGHGAAPLFADPERIDEPPTERSDVRAFALTLLCLATGLHEPPDLEEAYELRNPAIDEAAATSLSQLLGPCFMPHDERPTAAKLLSMAELLFPSRSRRRGSWPPEALRPALSTETGCDVDLGEEEGDEDALRRYRSADAGSGPCDKQHQPQQQQWGGCRRPRVHWPVPLAAQCPVRQALFARCVSLPMVAKAKTKLDEMCTSKF